MLLTCVAPCAARPTARVPSSTGPSNNRIVAVTDTSLGLYTPTFVRESPFTSPVNTVTAWAAEGGKPGMNIPTCPPPDNGDGDRNCDVTTRPPAAARLVNSIAPRESGAPNKLTQMSSNACASRGANWNVCCCPLNRYTAVTVNTSVYDVLNTLTSDTNGTPPTPNTDAATGSVTVSARRDAPPATRSRAAPRKNRSAA